MTRLLNFTRTQERRREGVFVCFGMKGEGDLYSSGGENMNGVNLEPIKSEMGVIEAI